MNKKTIFLRNILVAVSALGPTTMVNAQSTYTWTGANTVYSDAGNWAPVGGPPGSSDNVVLSAAQDIALTGSSSVTNFTMDLDASRIFRVGGTNDGLNRYYTISGTLTKSGSGVLTMRSNGNGSHQRMHLNINHLDLSEGVLALGLINNAFSLASLNIGSATISGGTMQIVVGNSSGTATITNDLNFAGAGTVQVRSGTASGVLAVGSLSSTGGNGIVEVNAQTTGSAVLGLLRLNNASGVSSYSGVLRDGGTIGNVLSVEKNNDGTQVLTGVNTYTGTTTINAGSLLVGVEGAGSLGNTAVTVNAGSLGGTGTVAGTVAVGNGAGSADAFLSAGDTVDEIGVFSISSALSLDTDATFVFEYNSSLVLADRVAANGVTIIDSLFSITDLGSGVLAADTQFIVINNTSDDAIAGRFLNLDDSSTFTIGSNEFRVSYSGGDGNDLVLTVVPEPATSALLGLGLVSVLFFRRRTN
jgi:fibronectin-binding autotransporter adhesin